MSKDSAFQYEVLKKSSGAPVALELLGGLLFQVFGVGNIVAGNVGIGLALMFSYWALQFFNILLMFVLVGFFTAPLTWVAFMVASPLIAHSAVQRENQKLYARLNR